MERRDPLRLLLRHGQLLFVVIFDIELIAFLTNFILFVHVVLILGSIAPRIFIFGAISFDVIAAGRHAFLLESLFIESEALITIQVSIQLVVIPFVVLILYVGLLLVILDILNKE